MITNNQPSSISLSWNGNIINATGNINEKDSYIELKFAPQDHNKYVIKKIQKVMKALNIRAKVKTIQNTSTALSKFKSINQIESPPLKEIIKPDMKISDNLVFDSIYLTVITYNSNQEITDWVKGDVIIKQLIKRHFGIDAKDSLFIDGSGLSRYDRVQPIILFS